MLAADAGKVGTGFSDELRRELLRRLEPERVAEPPVALAPIVRDMASAVCASATRAEPPARCTQAV